MDATPRFRLFDNRRGDNERDEESGRALTRRRMLTSVSVARQRRRNRRKPRAHRGLSLVPRLLSLSRSSGCRRRAVLLLLLGVSGTGVFVSGRLLAWAFSSPSLLPTGSLAFSGAVARNGGDDDAKRPSQHPKRRRPPVSLGPDAIPSALLVDRRPSPSTDLSDAALPGGALRASTLDTGSSPGGGINGGQQTNPYQCRNTVQGIMLLADSEGRVCRRTEVDDAHRRGCCAARPSATTGRKHGDDLAGGAARDNHGLGGESGLELEALPSVTRGRDDGFPPEQALSTPFSCWSCDVPGEGGTAVSGGGGDFSSCCRSYEFCVACCQDPGRDEEREAIQAAAARSAHPAFRELGSVESAVASGKELASQLRASAAQGQPGEDRNGAEENQERGAREVAFAHCAFRCRTYSGSVEHENSYRGPLKHCFGRFRPPAVSLAGMPTGGAQGRALPRGGGKVVKGAAGRGAAPLQLDPFLVGFLEA